MSPGSGPHIPTIARGLGLAVLGLACATGASAQITHREVVDRLAASRRLGVVASRNLRLDAELAATALARRELDVQLLDPGTRADRRRLDAARELGVGSILVLPRVRFEHERDTVAYVSDEGRTTDFRWSNHDLELEVEMIGVDDGERFSAWTEFAKGEIPTYLWRRRGDRDRRIGRTKDDAVEVAFRSACEQAARRSFEHHARALLAELEQLCAEAPDELLDELAGVRPPERDFSLARPAMLRGLDTRLRDGDSDDAVDPGVVGLVAALTPALSETVPIRSLGDCRERVLTCLGGLRRVRESVARTIREDVCEHRNTPQYRFHLLVLHDDDFELPAAALEWLWCDPGDRIWAARPGSLGDDLEELAPKLRRIPRPAVVLIRQPWRRDDGEVLDIVRAEDITGEALLDLFLRATLLQQDLPPGR